MKKYCVAYELKPECLEDYIKYHKEIRNGAFNQLIDVIKESGVKEEAIFIYKNLVIIYFEAEDLEKCYELQSNYEITKKWNKLMVPFFASDCELASNNDRGIPTLIKVFDLNE